MNFHKYDCINGCDNEFFNGKIQNGIFATQISWNEMEDIYQSYLFQEFQKVLKRKFEEIQNNAYLLLYDYVSYPIPFKLKHFGFWKLKQNIYNIDIIDSFEKTLELNSHCIIYGGSKVNYTDTVAKMIIDNGMKSLFVISKCEYNLETISNIYAKQIISNYSDNIGGFLNRFCINGDAVVLCIHGSGESSINIFERGATDLQAEHERGGV